MKIEDFEIVIIKNGDSGVFTAFPKNETLSGLVIQVDNFEDIPKEIAKSFKAMIEYSFEQKQYSITDFENES